MTGAAACFPFLGQPISYEENGAKSSQNSDVFRKTWGVLP